MSVCGVEIMSFSRNYTFVLISLATFASSFMCVCVQHKEFCLYTFFILQELFFFSPIVLSCPFPFRPTEKRSFLSCHSGLTFFLFLFLLDYFTITTESCDEKISKRKTRVGRLTCGKVKVAQNARELWRKLLKNLF